VVRRWWIALFHYSASTCCFRQQQLATPGGGHCARTYASRFPILLYYTVAQKVSPCRIINKSSSQLTPSQFIIVVSFTTLPLELCADELVVGGGVGWSYDRRRRRAAHFSSAAAVWLYWRRRRRQTGWESSETAHSLDRCFFLAYRGQPLHLWSPLGRRRRRLNCEYACFAHNFTVVMS